MLRRITLVALFGALIAGLSLMTPLAPVVRAESEAASSETGEEKLDRIVFINGNEVECEVLEETPTTVRVIVHFKGMPPVEATYNKSEIIEIQRGVGRVASMESRTEGVIEDENDEAEEIHPDAARLYLVDFDGTFGSDISETPLTELFEDVDELFDDLIPGVVDGERTMVVDPEKRDKHIVVIKMDCASDPRLGFDGIFRAEELSPIIEEQLQVKGRRVVFWIKEAVDGAAFLPWISPEIYFHPDGLMYFTQDLEEFSSGDDMVDEKLISARLGHAEGFAIDGGYEELADPVIKTMARSRYWLYYRLRGGEPEFRTRQITEEDEEELKGEGWILLSDSGKGDFEDKNTIRVFNDRLVLDEDIAKKLGISKGTVSDTEGLAYELGVHRNYTVLEGGGPRIFEKWHDDKEAAFERINREDGSLWLEFQRIEVQGDYSDRKRARGRQLNLLRKIYSDVSRFAEVWDPEGAFRSQLSTMMEQIKKQQQADKAAQRG